MTTHFSSDLKSTGLVVGVVQLNKIANKKNPNGPLEKQIKALTQEVKANPEKFLTLPPLEVYTAFAEASPQSVSFADPAPKILVNLITSRGQLPTISRVVDSMNVVSVQTGLTISAWDADKINGDITYRFSTGGEQYWPFMGEEVSLLPGELIAEDNDKVLCLFKYRDSQYAPVTLETERCVIHIQGIRGITEMQIAAALDALAGMLVASVGGDITVKEVLHA